MPEQIAGIYWIDDLVIVLSNIGILTAFMVKMGKWTNKVMGYAEKIDNVDIGLRRVDLVQRMSIDMHLHHETESICRLYDEYKSLGGNSYVDHMFSEYMVGTSQHRKGNS